VIPFFVTGKKRHCIGCAVHRIAVSNNTDIGHALTDSHSMPCPCRSHAMPRPYPAPTVPCPSWKSAW